MLLGTVLTRQCLAEEIEKEQQNVQVSFEGPKGEAADLEGSEHLLKLLFGEPEYYDYYDYRPHRYYDYDDGYYEPHRRVLVKKGGLFHKLFKKGGHKKGGYYVREGYYYQPHHDQHYYHGHSY